MNQPSGRFDRSKRGYWERRARLLSGYNIPPPIRPADSDIALYASWVRTRASSLSLPSFTTAVLGITRAIASMPWPVGSEIFAFDWSVLAAQRIWPSGAAPRNACVAVADWRQLPLADASVDLVVGDTCCSSMSSKAESIELFDEVARIAKPGAWWIQRCFVRPQQQESVDLVFSKLDMGRLSSFEVFCFRLAMAMQGESDEGVKYGQVWKTWNRHFPEPRSLFDSLGWNPQGLAFIERWKDEDARIYFPSIFDLREIVASDFELVETRFPDYDMGECCPMIVLQRA